MNQPPAAEDVIRTAYRLFNQRDIEATVALMSDDVAWPNGMEGGYLHGKDAVRSYWTRQWAMIDPHVEPVSMELLPDGRIDVTVHQLVRRLDGTLQSDRTCHHLYTLRDGVVARMEIVD